MEKHEFDIVRPGLLSYEAGVQLQWDWHRRVANSESRGAFIVCEHPLTVTLGKNQDHKDLITGVNFLRQQGAAIHQSDRGGQATFHMPGQLVVYPILPVTKLALGAREYVSVLERGVLRLLQDFSLQPQLDEKFPGVWIENRKICALGVRIAKRVSLHGLALNVNNDLAPFDWIVPCGIAGRSVTSLQKETHQSHALTELGDRLVRIIIDELAQ